MNDEDRVDWSTRADDEDRISWSTGADDEGLVRWETDRGRREKTERITIRDEIDVGKFQYCGNCGKKIDLRAEICPNCGLKVTKVPLHEKRSNLSFIGGVLVGFIALILLSGIPILGPILAGFIAGVLAGGGAGRGAAAGFFAGIVGFLLLAILVFAIGVSVFGTSIESLFEMLSAVIGSFIAIALIIVGLFYSLLCLVGGAIGGSLRK